jgi:hypothetical protein
VEIYKQKADEYFERASYIKKQVMSKDKDESMTSGGGSAAAAKK